MKTTHAAANAVADATFETAYSASRYGKTEWRKAARLLADRGFNARQIEAVLRSKWTRWASDAADHSKGKAADLILYIDKHVGTRLNSQLAELITGTFGAYAKEPPVPEPTSLTGADLAGDCEGEDIADLIDFALTVAAGTAHSADLTPRARRILDRIKSRRG